MSKSEIDKIIENANRYINEQIETAVKQKLEFLDKNPDYLEDVIKKQQILITQLKKDKATAIEALQFVDKTLFKVKVPIPSFNNPDANLVIDTRPVKIKVREALFNLENIKNDTK